MRRQARKRDDICRRDGGDLVPTGATGYALDHWGGTNGAEATSGGAIVMNGNKNITAVFVKLQYDLDVTTDGNGVVSVYIAPTSGFPPLN